MPAAEPRAAEIVIIGSGPAGISAAWPLVRAGIDVVLLDAGKADLPAPPSGTIGGLRGGEAWFHHVHGGAPPVPEPAQDRSPKLATPLARAALDGYAAAIGLRAQDFLAAGSLAPGGLSTIWGAAVPQFGAADIAHFPCPPADMHAAYARVLARIGASSPAPRAAPVEKLFRRHARCRDGFELVPARNAVLAQPQDGRAECTQCGLCLWGCARRSIYSAAYELPALRAHANFRHLSGYLARDIVPEAGGHAILLEHAQGGPAPPLHARRVVLAAGTIATTALALRRLGMLERELRLLTNPVAALACVVPGEIGADLPAASFSLGQLAYRLALPGGAEASGLLYAADTLPLGAIADRLPLGRPTALRVARALAPALVLATCYLPGTFSRNVLRAGADGRITVRGEQTEAARAALRQAAARLGGFLRRRGAYVLPGSVTLSPPGSDAHYAGTFPMGGDTPTRCAADGEVLGAPGLHIADGACLPVLPAQHCTLTIMANADRIGHALAGRAGRAGVPA